MGQGGRWSTKQPLKLDGEMQRDLPCPERKTCINGNKYLKNIWNIWHKLQNLLTYFTYLKRVFVFKLLPIQQIKQKTAPRFGWKLRSDSKSKLISNSERTHALRDSFGDSSKDDNFQLKVWWGSANTTYKILYRIP